MRFGPFEANLDTGELSKHGVRLKLHDQPFQVLAMLVARPGELVSREEIQAALWPDGTFVDFENGLNSAVNRLRDALSDSSETPKYIETVPRRGYRFVARIELVDGKASVPAVDTTESIKEPLIAPDRAAMILPASRRWLWGAGAFATVLLAVATFGAWRRVHSAKPAISFAARDWVLVSNFDNRTGESRLDGTLEYAVERELSNSQFVNVVPRERLDDVLRLMRRPLDIEIDRELGREICVRDSGIRALLTGRVEKLGTTYVLSAEVVDPVRGVTVASISEEGPADTQLAAAVRQLSNRVRETLGEKAAEVQQSNQQLEKVTTPSLHALQLYSQADDMMRAGGQAAAAELLKQAIAEDPDFASAHLLLAYTYENQEKIDQAKPEFERARELAGSASDRERLFILASYIDKVEKDVPRAISAYESLLRVYPDHYWATNNLYAAYRVSGQWEDMRRVIYRLADLRPDDLGWNRIAACGKYNDKGTSGGRRYAERAMTLAKGANDEPEIDFLERLPVFQSWVEGDISKVRSQLLQLDHSGKGVIDPAYLLALGQWAEAEKAAESLEDKNGRSVHLGYLAFLRGDSRETRRQLERLVADGAIGITADVVLGRSGMWREQSRLNSPLNFPAIWLEKGERALAEGKTKEGKAFLERALDALSVMPFGGFFLGSESLARVYENEGDLGNALRILQRASAAKGRVNNCFNNGLMAGMWWLRTELQLADLYRKMGRVQDAEKVEDGLRKMLVYADADHPILRELQKRERLAAANSSATGRTSH